MTDLINDVPLELRERFIEIIEITDRFCSQYLNPEYQDLCRKMAAAICQADLPVERGKAEGWASGVVYAVGYVNFLTDPSSEPHMRAEEIAKGCGVSVATMHGKWKAIREELDVRRFDPDFGLMSTLERNPFTWMAETKDGLLVDFRHVPREVQAEAFRKGLIPFAPGESELSEKESSQQRELRSRYQHLRLVNKDLCQKLIGLLSRDIVLEAGERLGLLVPETEDGIWPKNFHEQVEWEHQGLEAASTSGCVAAWVPRELEKMPGFTTNVEFGLYVGCRRFVYGRPYGAPHTGYLDWLYTLKTAQLPFDRLEDLMRAAIAMANG